LNEITNILTIDKYVSDPTRYNHLFEIATQPNPNIIWQVRDEFNSAGTLMVGDLNLSETETNQLEIHPFPEWVIKIFQPGKKPTLAYALVPNLNKKQIEELNSLNISERIIRINKFLGDLTSKDIIAVEYHDGMCLKIPRNVPHYFISKIESNQDIPYLQVFEPRIDFIKDFLGYESTIYFHLQFRLKIKKDETHTLIK
jgi:hypothetical protein